MLARLFLLLLLLGLALAQDCVVFEYCAEDDCSGSCDKVIWEQDACVQHNNDTDVYFTFESCGEELTTFLFFSDANCIAPTIEVNVSFPSCDTGHSFVKCDTCENIEDARTISIVVGVIAGLLVLLLLALCIGVCVKDNKYKQVAED
jgi:hypothetical protein